MSKKRQPIMTVRRYQRRVADLCPRRSRDTYNAGFARLVAALGDRPLTAVTLPDLMRLRDQTAEEVGLRVVADARARRRQLRSYEPRAHGYGAAENFVRSARFFFRCAVGDRLLSRSPATELHAPPRPPAPERALTSEELDDVYRIAATTGTDAQLDRLLLDFLRETAARRSGAVGLVLGALDFERRAITLTEKRGQSRDVPASPQLLQRLRAFATERGATLPGDAVFRYGDGHPLTRRRFNSLFDRIDRHTGWSERLDVGAHWIRHTTLTDIALVSDIRVAAAYAGHTSPSRDITLRYTKPTFAELAAAHDALFPPSAPPTRASFTDDAGTAAPATHETGSPPWTGQ